MGITPGARLASRPDGQRGGECGCKSGHHKHAYSNSDIREQIESRDIVEHADEQAGQSGGDDQAGDAAEQRNTEPLSQKARI
ncbi:MAG: hypothetical protein ACRD19_07195 [Terriglobia bacterium]